MIINWIGIAEDLTEDGVVGAVHPDVITPSHRYHEAAIATPAHIKTHLSSEIETYKCSGMSRSEHKTIEKIAVVALGIVGIAFVSLFAIKHGQDTTVSPTQNKVPVETHNAPKKLPTTSINSTPTKEVDAAHQLPTKKSSTPNSTITPKTSAIKQDKSKLKSSTHGNVTASPPTVSSNKLAPISSTTSNKKRSTPDQPKAPREQTSKPGNETEIDLNTYRELTRRI